MLDDNKWCVALAVLLAGAGSNSRLVQALEPAATPALRQCGEGESVTFEKFSGVRPERGEPVFIYTARPDEPSLGGACTARCLHMARCDAVSVAHGRAECTGYAPAAKRTLHQENDVNFFVKICMKIPQDCERRWWAVETTAGYQLHSEGSNAKVISNITSMQCSRALIDTSGPRNRYRSAQWVPSGSLEDAYTMDGERSSLGVGDVGSCVLNVEDKYTEPESYRVANFRTLYKENQCRHDFPDKIDRCSYEEYYNQTLKHVEVSLKGFSMDMCKASCEKETRFVCRGFSWKRERTESGESLGQCSLHSEDILTLGSWLLRRAPGASYYRRVLCLNISVECTNDEMVVTYRPRGQFHGRVYVPGRGERCGTEAGSRGGPVRLALPLHGPCDVNFAYAVSTTPQGGQNKTMAYAMVMIQNNAIIQTAGDRWVRVGCAPGDQHARHPHTLDAALTVSVHTVKETAASGEAMGGVAGAGVRGPVPASAVFNVSGTAAAAPPALTMYVVRAGGGGGTLAGSQPRGAVSLGEILEMRVETADKNEIEAYHLVASSRLGDSSVLLLDNRGCTTGQVDFPGFTRSWLGEGQGAGPLQRLTARFKAFRFPHSHVVRFALMVRFCTPRCPQTRCDRGFGARSRIARQTNGTALESDMWLNELSSGEAADVREENSSWERPLLETQRSAPYDELDVDSGGGGGGGLVVAQSGAGAGCGAGDGRVPLELELVVGSRDLLTADTLVRAEHQSGDGGSSVVATAGAGGLVCMHELLVVALVLAWLLVQLLLLVGCCVVVKRYRKFAEMASQKDYQSFDNIGFDTISTHRRVHWPDQNVDILHIN